MRTKLVILLSIVMGVIVLLVTMRDTGSLQPFRTQDAYVNISRLTTDADNATYTITNSKKIIHKADSEGVLSYTYSSGEGADSNEVRLFNSIAADDEGNAYALITVLDSFGLKVLGEQIIQINSNGTRVRVLYDVQYGEGDNLLRVGKIQSLSIEGDELYFFRKDDSIATLLKLSIADQFKSEPQTVTTVQLSQARYLNELTGHHSSQLFFTTKRGKLFADQEGQRTQLYPPSSYSGLSFPMAIATHDHQYIYFIDDHDASIKRVSAGGSNSLEVVLKMDELVLYKPDMEWSEFTNISTHDNGIVISTSDQIIWLDANGTIVDVKDSFRYPGFIIVQRVLYWLLIFALTALVVYLLRFIYIDVMKRKVFLLLKQLAVILPVVFLSMVGLSYSVYSSFSVEMKNDTYKQLRILAANGKYLVDGDRLSRLNSPLDYKGDDYVAIKQRVNEVFSRAGEDRAGLYNTIYRYMNGQLYIVMDDDDSATMFQPFPISEDNNAVLQHGEIVLGEWEDSSGEWMYALGPLFNSSGEIIGIYETGKDMIGVNQSNRNILSDLVKIFALIGIILLIVITLMTVYLLSSIRKLRRIVNLIASGEWNVKVDIRTRDEVEELGERFNMMASSINQYIQEVTKLSNSYFRFVPQQFLKVLGKSNMTQIHLGEQQNRKMTIMVCNMRGFNEMSSSLSSEQNFQFINSFLKKFGPIIRQYGGFTSRYLGPGMLTMFPNETDAALKASYKLRQMLEHYNEERTQKRLDPIDIGISIHSGEVMLGIIGEEQRMEGSVVSNHVQLALDLEKVSAKLGVTILMTADTLKAVKSNFNGQYRSLGSLQIDADQEPVELYDWYEGDSEHIRKLKHETKHQFEASVQAFSNGRFYDAREGFVAVVKKNRYDLAAKLYFFECDRYFQQGVTESGNHALRIS